MQQIFLPYTAEQRSTGPILLFYDNFGAHVTPTVLRLCANNITEVVGFPPHSSHYLQPLDRSCNGPLKKHYATSLGHWRLNHGIWRTPTTQDMLLILAKPQDETQTLSAWDKAFSPSNIKAGFAAAGIYPFNRNACAEHFPTDSPASSAASAPSPQPSSGTSSTIGALMAPPPFINPSTDSPANIPMATLLTSEEHLRFLEAEAARKAAEEAAAQDRRDERAARAEARKEEEEEKAKEKHANQWVVNELKADPFFAFNALQQRITNPVTLTADQQKVRKEALARYHARKRARNA